MRNLEKPAKNTQQLEIFIEHTVNLIKLFTFLLYYAILFKLFKIYFRYVSRNIEI